MNRLKTTQALLALAALGLLASGCATQNGNPPRAGANTGYVDFHADPAADLCWQVERFDDRTQSFRSVFSAYKPPPNGILRLGFAPGHYRLRVTFLNRTVLEPTQAEVGVKDGMITPVRIEFTDAEAATVETKETSVGGTAYGRYGRRTKIGSSENPIYQAKALPEPPQAYRLKEQMPYAH
jgi:hypothetical protein